MITNTGGAACPKCGAFFVPGYLHTCAPVAPHYEHVPASPASEETRGPTLDRCPSRMGGQRCGQIAGHPSARTLLIDSRLLPVAVSPVEQPSEPETVAWALMDDTGLTVDTSFVEANLARAKSTFDSVFPQRSPHAVVPLVRRSDYDTLAARCEAILGGAHVFETRWREAQADLECSLADAAATKGDLVEMAARVSSLESQLGEAQRERDRARWFGYCLVLEYAPADKRVGDMFEDANRLRAEHESALSVLREENARLREALPIRTQPGVCHTHSKRACPECHPVEIVPMTDLSEGFGPK